MNELVESLKSLTKTDILFWHALDLGGKEPSDLAYVAPWMICFDAEDERTRKPILQVAKSYHSWTELEGLEYDLGSLMIVIAGQRSRVSRGLLIRSELDPAKVKKFKRDKLLRAERAERQRIQILNSCLRSLRNH